MSGTISSKESKAPVFTSPACTHTIAGPSTSRSVACSWSQRMRPWSSTATRRVEPLPIPTSRRARSIVTWRRSPATTVIGGDPATPSCSTSQPTRSSTACRAAAKQVAWAIWQPVTNENDAVAGMPRSSFSHSPATSSTTAADGPAIDESGVLVPHRGEPVRGESSWKRSADHEAEVAPARDADDARLRRGGQRVDDLQRFGRPLGQRPSEIFAEFLDSRRRPNRPRVERVEKVGRKLGRAL